MYIKNQLRFLATLLLLLLCFFNRVFATSEPIPGVDIIVKKKCNPSPCPKPHSIETNTDPTGKFSSKVEAGEYELTLSFADIAKRISIDLKDYAVHPENYEISLSLGANISDITINGKRTPSKFPPGSSYSITKETPSFSITIPTGGATLTGVLTYNKKENNQKDSIDHTHDGPGKGLNTPVSDVPPTDQKLRGNQPILDTGLKNRSKTMIYVGAGYNFLNKTTKSDAFINNAAGVNASLYQPLVARKVFTFGIQTGLDYSFSTKDNPPATPAPFHVIGETSSTVAMQNSGSGLKQSVFKVDLGPQLNIHAGEHFAVSAAFMVGAMVFNQPEFTAVQKTLTPTTKNDYTLMRKWDVTAGGVVLTPKLRVNYLINDWVGIWAEVNYTFLPSIKSTITVFNPQDTPNDSGYYDSYQLDHGTTTTEQRVTKYSSIGVNGGLVFSFGKREKKCPCDEEKFKVTDKVTTSREKIILITPMDQTDDITDKQTKKNPKDDVVASISNREVDAKGRPSSGVYGSKMVNTSTTDTKPGQRVESVDATNIESVDDTRIALTRDVDAKGRPSSITNKQDMQVPKTAGTTGKVDNMTIKGNGKTTADGVPVVEGKTVAGNIKMKNGMSNAGVTVKIEQKETGDHASDITDANGNFSMVLGHDTIHLVWVNGLEYGKIKIMDKAEK